MAETGTYYDGDFARALGARGWIAAGWPVEEGGSGRNWLEQVALNQELRRAEAPVDAIGTTMLIAETLRMFGTPEQKETIMKPAVRGEVVIALGYTRARLRFGRRRRPDPGGARRRGVGDRRREDVHHAGPGGRLRLLADPDQHRGEESTGA